MKVLTILNSAGIGGVEKTLLSCLKVIPRDKLKMSILCFSNEGELENDFKDLGVDFIYIKKTGLIIFDALQLMYVIIKYKFDIVHSRFGFTSGGFVLACKILGVKSFVSLHNTEPSSLKSYKSKKGIYTILLTHLKIHKFLTKKFATKIIGHSKSNLNANYPNWAENPKYELLYNGIDFSQLPEKALDDPKLDDFTKIADFIILHIGSFRRQKNHLFLIDCFGELNPKEKNIKLILVGKGGDLNKVKKKVAKLGLNEYVYFAGFDKDVNKYLNKSDLFFFPSVNEGLANVLIEAQYKGVPICASDIPPLYESGYKGYHNYFFDPYDINSAVSKLETIITDIKAKDLDEIKIKARAYVDENFSIETMANRLLKLYAQ